MSLQGFAKALEGALELHRLYPSNKQQLVAKHGPPSTIKVPEEFPSLKGKYGSKLDYDGQVVKSCIHCHQVGEALRQWPRSEGKPISEQILFPYPHPKSLGLIMDPKQRARVLAVTPHSPAASAGFQAGDEIVTLGGQPILSMADMQWVFHHAGETATIPAEVERGDKTVSVSLVLDKGWRRQSNISWRATSWDLRRMAFGGMVLEDLPADERARLKLSEDELGLLVKHVGQYNAHAVAKNAGFRKGDIVVAVEGRTNRLNETNLLADLLHDKRPGDRVSFTVVRGDEKLTMAIPMQ